MGVLEDKITSMEQDIIKLKSSQILGGDNYTIHTEQTTATLISSSTIGGLWVWFESTSELPLCQWDFTVIENGIVVTPTDGYGFINGNSKSQYHFIYNWGAVMLGQYQMPSFNPFDPHRNVIIVMGGNANLTIKVRSTQPGIIRSENLYYAT